MSKVLRRKFTRLVIAIMIAVSAFVVPYLCSHGVISLPSFTQYPYFKNGLLILAWLIAGAGVIGQFFRNIKLKQFFDENTLMTIATFGAILLGDFAEAVAVMVLYEIGEYLQTSSVMKSEKSISEIVNIRAAYANVERDGKVEKVKPDGVMIGENIIIKPGERIPLDGVVIAGQSTINVSPLTGESLPREVNVRDYVFSGCINLTGVIKIKTDKFYNDCAVNKLMSLVETAQKSKSKTEKFITRFAKMYTPIVFSLAVLLVIGSIIYNIYVFNLWHFNFKAVIEHALTFLVIACPCAFVISVPLTFFSGVGAASKWGILVKGSEFLETLSNVNTAVFDKTGTLTAGVHKVIRVFLSSDTTREELAEAVLKAEAASNHPIAAAIKKEFGGKENQVIKNSNITEIAGKGMWLAENGMEILAGNKELMQDYNVPIFEHKQDGTKVYVAKNKKYLGCIVVSDEIKQSAKILISKLIDLGIKPVMLTGDIKDNAEVIAKSAGIDEWYAGLLPEDKVKKLETIIKQNKKDKKVMYTGDGINDAPVITRADVGIAMGAIGSQSAIEASDVVITDDNLAKVYLILNIAKKTMRTVKQNIILALGVKVLFMVLAVFGYMPIWIAIFADTGVTLLAVLNSLKILNMKNTEF